MCYMFYFHAQGDMDQVDAAPGVREVLAQIAARCAAQAGAENFPVALRILPRNVRTDLQHIYDYARFVDDVGDEAPGERSTLLDAVAADVHAVSVRRVECAPVEAMRGLIAGRSMPIEAMLKLIAANRMDQVRTRYETFEDLLDYCALSAAPVGEMVLCVADAATPANLADSAAVCAGLQVLEHCQDVREDALAGRIYLAGAQLRAAGVQDSDLTGDSTGTALRTVIAQHVARARELLEAGVPLVRRVRGWSRLAISGYVAGGIATADALAAADYDVLARAVRPSTARTAVRAVRLLISGRT
ncbi:MAG TPA: squalene/phytoene synthase family protein [Jatrophihabitantaceae bacterium]